MNIPPKIDISIRTILFIAVFSFLIWFVFQIREILFLVFISFIIMSALKPTVEFLERYYIPRAVSLLIVYVLILVSLGYIISAVVPLLSEQSIHLADNIGKYIKSTFPFLTLDSQLVSQQITSLGENLLKVTLGVFSTLIVFFTMFVISFFGLI